MPFSGSMTIFGEGHDFPSRMVLIYDGIHYDPLYYKTPEGVSQSIYPTSDNRLGLFQCQKLSDIFVVF